MLTRITMLLFVLALFVGGCDKGAVATGEGKPVDVLVASNPSGAEVLMQGAVLGKTPMKVPVRQSTPVEVRLAGYASQTVFLEPQGPGSYIVTLQGSAPPPAPAAPAPAPAVASAGARHDADFARLVKDLNLQKQTKLYVVEHWKNYHGEEVSWTGKVIDVKGGRGKAVVYLAKDESPKYKGYNVILTVPDTEAAGNLHKKDIIRFRGTLEDYKPIKSGGVIIYVNPGEIVGKG